MIAVLEVLLAFAVFEAVEELAFIDVIFVFSQTVAFLSAICPLTLIAVSVEAAPDSETMFSACFPFSLIDFSIIPLKSAFSFSQIIRVAASIDPIIGELTTLNHLSILKSPLKHVFRSDDKSKAVHLIGKLPKIDSLIGCHDLRLFLFEESFEVEVDVDWVIALDEFFVLIFGRDPELFVLSDCEEFAHFREIVLCQFTTEFCLFGIFVCFRAEFRTAFLGSQIVV